MGYLREVEVLKENGWLFLENTLYDTDDCDSILDIFHEKYCSSRGSRSILFATECVSLPDGYFIYWQNEVALSVLKMRIEKCIEILEQKKEQYEIVKRLVFGNEKKDN